MAEELQRLIDKIQKDGVDKAEAEAEKINADARKKADSIIAEAEQKASEIVKTAENDAATFERRARKALQQAARDTIISVNNAVTESLENIAAREVKEILSRDNLAELIVSAVKAYMKDSKSSLDVLVNPDEKQRISDYLISKLKEDMRQGLKVKSDSAIFSGFTVSIRNEGLEHDFTGRTIAESLSALLRPELAEIMRNTETSADKKS